VLSKAEVLIGCLAVTAFARASPSMGVRFSKPHALHGATFSKRRPHAPPFTHKFTPFSTELEKKETQT